MEDDEVWYELAYVAGITNGLNVVADGLMLRPDSAPVGRGPLAPLVDPDQASAEVREVFAEICAFYASPEPPAVFRWMAHDLRFLRGYWGATRAAFADGRLDRLTKEVLALAASLAAKSSYGVDLHLREVRRLGLPDDGITEVFQVVQLFSTVTKIADALGLEPDFSAAPASSAMSAS